MKKTAILVRYFALAATAIVPAVFGAHLLAAPPQANAVPFVASSPTTPHTSWSGNPVRLKGTLTSTDFPAHTFTYDWDPGNGAAHCAGTVTDQFVIECPVTYAGVVGTVFKAVLVITDTTSSQVSPPANCPPSVANGACYYTSLNNPPPNLPVEVNNAIDNGLWYLHKKMIRTTSGGGAPIGNWNIGDGSNVDANQAATGINSLDCTAFQVSGFLQTNVPVNPYSLDVGLCLTGVFDQLTTISVSNVIDPVTGSFDPDSNGNHIGVSHNGYPVNYQTGMMMDAIIATGTPGTLVPAGTNLSTPTAGLGTGAGGAYTYKDAVFDMVDNYVFCQNEQDSTFGGSRGGWHYSCQETTGDNSASQWAAIGIIPARRNFGATTATELKGATETWMDASFTQASVNNGYFGYNGGSPIWGPYADTPSGMVQLAMTGLGRGTISPGGKNLWDSAETFIRDNFGNPQSLGPGNGNPAGGTPASTGSMKAYYYGMFSFTKAMLLHDNSGTGLLTTPITLLHSLDDPNSCAAPGVPVTAPGSGAGPCYPPIDWYAAQTAAFGGIDATDGVARTIVGNQFPLTGAQGGSWFGQNYTSTQSYFQTAISIIMLNKTVFQPVPVACFTSNPSHVASGGPVTLDGGCSVDQNPANTLVSWQWDISGTNAGYTIGPGNPKCLTPSCSKMIANFTLPAGQSLPYNYPVKLRVTDNAVPPLTATVSGAVVISSPPNPPNANAGGPYNFCPNTTPAGATIYAPFLLDGSHSTNPDQGNTDGTAGAPPSTITAYDWDYACAGTYTSAHGAQVDSTSAFNQAAFFGTTFNVCLRVTNNDNLAFPTAGLAAGLSSVAAGQVSIHQPTDEVCTHCVQTLGGKAKAPAPGSPANIQLYWTDTNNSAQFTIGHYNIYRSTSASFTPFTQIAGASSTPFVAAVPVSSPAGGTLFFKDSNVTGGVTYYYRIAPATVNDTETCQGNVTLPVSVPRGR